MEEGNSVVAPFGLHSRPSAEWKRLRRGSLWHTWTYALPLAMNFRQGGQAVNFRRRLAWFSAGLVRPGNGSGLSS